MRYIDIGRIARIKEIKNEIMVLSAERDVVASPLMTDFGRIAELYRHFTRFTGGVDIDVWWRKVFLFVVLYLYSPQALCGGKMPSGLRKAISGAMGINGNVISYNCSDLLFMFKVYSSFRGDVDTFLGYLADAISSPGLACEE